MCQLPQVLAQGDAAHLLTAHRQLLSTQAARQRGVKTGLGLGQSHPPPQDSHPGLRSDSKQCWWEPGELELTTYPLSKARSGQPGSLPVISTRRLNNRVAPTKPSPEPAASATQKARKEEKSSLFQKA